MSRVQARREGVYPRPLPWISEGWSRGPLCCAVRLRTAGGTGPISKTPNVYAAQDDRTAPHHQEPPPLSPHILKLGFWDLFGIWDLVFWDFPCGGPVVPLKAVTCYGLLRPMLRVRHQRCSMFTRVVTVLRIEPPKRGRGHVPRHAALCRYHSFLAESHRI